MQSIQISTYHDYHLYKGIKIHSECPDCMAQLADSDPKAEAEIQLKVIMLEYANIAGDQALRHFLDDTYSEMMGQNYILQQVKGN